MIWYTDMEKMLVVVGGQQEQFYAYKAEKLIEASVCVCINQVCLVLALCGNQRSF
jgi:arginine/ornithine N-succinyltransferase beta subunit